MPQSRRKRGRHRGAAGKANSDLMTHIASLGLETVQAYKGWCKDHGLKGALTKSWQDRRDRGWADRPCWKDTEAGKGCQGFFGSSHAKRDKVTRDVTPLYGLFGHPDKLGGVCPKAVQKARRKRGFPVPPSNPWSPP